MKKETQEKKDELNVGDFNTFHDFLSEHLEDPYTKEDLMNVIKTINPANGKVKSVSKLTRGKSKTDVIFQGQMLFDFPDEKSAKLFKSIKEKLQKNTEGKTLNVVIKGTRVRLDTDPEDAYYLTHKTRKGVSPENQKRIDVEFKKREENRMISDNMLLVTSTLLDSQIYRHNEKKIFKLPVKIDSKEKYDHYSLKLKKESSITVYRNAVMEQNAIPKNMEFEKEVIEEVKNSMKMYLDDDAGNYMIQNLFKTDNSSAIHRSINQENILAREYADRSNNITPQSIERDNGFLQRTSKRIQEIKSNTAEILALSSERSDSLKSSVGERFNNIRYR